MVDIQSKGQVNERVEFVAMEDGRVYYIFPKIKGWIKSKELTVDATPQLEVYPNGETECSIKKEAIAPED